MGRWWNSLHEWKNLHFKQLRNTRANPTRKSQSSKYGTFRTTKNAWVNQKKLLVARNQEWYKGICLRICQMPTKQSIAYEESRRTSPIKNTRRTLARNQYWYHKTITKIKWTKCYSGYSRLIYKDSSTQSNNNYDIIRRDCQNL